MGRPGLTRHRKFSRVVRALDKIQVGFGEILARGALELLWDTTYENGDELLGDADDVENAAHWRGERGLLARALLEAGGADEDGFIEVRCTCGGTRKAHKEGKACESWRPAEGRYFVHDLLDHAPEYVATRREKELERRKTKVCEGCGREYHSPDKRSKHCTAACRTRAWRDRDESEPDTGVTVRHNASPETDADGSREAPRPPVLPGGATVTEACATVRHGDATGTVCDTPPAPAPAPAPALTTARSLARAKRKTSGPEAEHHSDRPADAASEPIQPANSPPSPGEPVAGDDGGTRGSTDGGRDAAPSGDAPAALGRAAQMPEGGPPTPGAPQRRKAPRPADPDAGLGLCGRPVLIDVTELSPPAASVRGEIEKRLGYRLDLAPGFAEEVERLGEDRALEVYALEAADYIARNTGKRIQSLAFFVTVGKRYQPAVVREVGPCAEWDAIVGEYERLPADQRLPPTAFEYWVRPLQARMDDGVLRLTSPTADHAEYVAQNLLAGFRKLALKALGGAITIEVGAALLTAAGGV